jgi:hypothetical protein
MRFKSKAISNFRLDDASVIMDLTNMMLKTNKVSNISIDFATTLIRKNKILLESNYMVTPILTFRFISELGSSLC